MIIDTAQNTTRNLIHLQADAVTAVMRYLTSTGSSKLVTPAEAMALGAAGIRLGLVFENGGGSPGYDDISAEDGRANATFCLNYVSKLGAPQDSTVCIYFACDNDFIAPEITTNVLPYFSAIAEVFDGSPYLVGVYGSGAVCAAVCNPGPARYAWLSGSKGWTNSRTYLAAKPSELVLVQDKMDIMFANMDCDTDYSLGEFGDFLPSAAVA